MNDIQDSDYLRSLFENSLKRCRIKLRRRWAYRFHWDDGIGLEFFQIWTYLTWICFIFGLNQQVWSNVHAQVWTIVQPFITYYCRTLSTPRLFPLTQELRSSVRVHLNLYKRSLLNVLTGSILIEIVLDNFDETKSSGLTATRLPSRVL